MSREQELHKLLLTKEEAYRNLLAEYHKLLDLVRHLQCGVAKIENVAVIGTDNWALLEPKADPAVAGNAETLTVTESLRGVHNVVLERD